MNLRKIIWIEIATKLQFAEDGTIEALGVSRDITERKKADQNLAQYKKIVNTTTGHMSLVDKNYIYRTVNNAYLNAHEIEEHQIIGRSVADILGSDLFEKVAKEKFDLCLSGKKVVYQEWFNFKAFGERYMNVSYYPYFDENNEITGIIVDGNDITEIKNNQVALLEAEQRYKIVADFAYDWEYWKKPDNSLEYISPACKRITGYSDKEFLTEPNLLGEIVVDEDKSVWDNHTEEENYGNKLDKLSEIQFRIKRKDGKIIWIDHACHRVITDEGIFLGYRASNRDITEKKIIQEEIAEYVEELQIAKDTLEQNAGELVQINMKLEESEKGLLELNASKDKFFSIISHGLKSPFNGILGITEMLVSDYDELTSDDIKEMVHVLRNSSVKVFDLLEGLLEWAQTQTGRMEYKFENIDFYETSSKTVNLLKTNAENKNILLENNVKESTHVFADKKATETVLRNLIVNAIKFTQSDGIIKIETGERENEIAISVSDSGIGMSEEDRSKLFRIDVHYTTVGTNNESGTGVGLILCKELVEKHSGKIWVESELGKGSKFIFALPKKDSGKI